MTIHVLSVLRLQYKVPSLILRDCPPGSGKSAGTESSKGDPISHSGEMQTGAPPGTGGHAAVADDRSSDDGSVDLDNYSDLEVMLDSDGDFGDSSMRAEDKMASSILTAMAEDKQTSGSSSLIPVNVQQPQTAVPPDGATSSQQPVINADGGLVSASFVEAKPKIPKRKMMLKRKLVADEDGKIMIMSVPQAKKKKQLKLEENHESLLTKKSVGGEGDKAQFKKKNPAELDSTVITYSMEDLLMDQSLQPALSADHQAVTSAGIVINTAAVNQTLTAPYTPNTKMKSIVNLTIRQPAKRSEHVISSQPGQEKSLTRTLSGMVATATPSHVSMATPSQVATTTTSSLLIATPVGAHYQHTGQGQGYSYVHSAAGVHNVNLGSTVGQIEGMSTVRSHMGSGELQQMHGGGGFGSAFYGDTDRTSNVVEQVVTINQTSHNLTNS